LRRVATLVARGVSPEDVFAAVTEEVGGLFPVSNAAMGRYDSDGMFTTVAIWNSGVAAGFPEGRRWFPEGKNITALVFETGRRSCSTALPMPRVGWVSPPARRAIAQLSGARSSSRAACGES
jgi:hypothetical protein